MQIVQTSPFCLNIVPHTISRMLIPNPDLDFWNFNTKINFCANLATKIESCSCCLKNRAPSISRLPIPNPKCGFWNSDSQKNFWAILTSKMEIWPFCLKIAVYTIWRMLIPNPDLDFWNSNHKNNFWASLCPNLSNLSVLSEYRSTYYLKDANSKSRLRFLKFRHQNQLLGKFGHKNWKLFMLS